MCVLTVVNVYVAVVVVIQDMYLQYNQLIVYVEVHVCNTSTIFQKKFIENRELFISCLILYI